MRVVDFYDASGFTDAQIKVVDDLHLNVKAIRRIGIAKFNGRMIGNLSCDSQDENPWLN